MYLVGSLLASSKLANKECVLRPEIRLTRFLELVLAPTVLMRYAVYFFSKATTFDRLQLSIFFLSAYWNIAYGVWTIINLNRILKMENK